MQILTRLYRRVSSHVTTRRTPLYREVQSGGMVVHNHHILEGVDLGVGIYSMHHHGDHYLSPFTFDPERWLTKHAHDAFFPFLLGPRKCLGMGLAYMEIYLFIARVVYLYDFVIEGNLGEEKKRGGLEYMVKQTITAGCDLQSVGPMMRFTPRKGAVVDE